MSPAKPRAAAIRAAAPAGFSFAATVESHGWRNLAPYSFDEDTGRLHAVWRLSGGPPVGLELREVAGGVGARPNRALTAVERTAVLSRLRYAFSFDADTSGLHALCRRVPHLRWIARRGMGRLLRGEDLFEDALKTLLTTNCTWTQTIAMTRRLVDVCGTVDPQSGGRAFPSPEAVLVAGAAKLDADVRLGYRTRAALELAELASEGGLDPVLTEPPPAARKRIRSWFGFGPYAAASLLQVLGRNDEVVVDSWATAQAREHFFGGRRCTPAQIRRIYAPYGAEAGKIAWFDLNREHFGVRGPRPEVARRPRA